MLVLFFQSALTSGTIVNEGGEVYGGHGALLSFANHLRVLGQ